MRVVDTNVLLHAAHARSPWHTPCRALLERLRADGAPWHVTWSIVYEFVRLATLARTFERPWSTAEAWRFVEALIASPSFSVLEATPRHAAVAALVFGESPELRGNVVHDAHIAILMREHGIRQIYTRDADFHRFPFVEVIDPATRQGPPGVAERSARYAARRRRAARA
jgi:toxin-antitoxin system PIN domain toxin